jgi:16S rRNA (adenine1518-N6/adenine1519-N6)-dimethyltransferase
VVRFKPKVFFQDRGEERRFRTLTKKAFAHRRKTMINSLALCGINKAAAGAALAKHGFKPTARAQEISLEGFAALAAEPGMTGE